MREGSHGSPPADGSNRRPRQHSMPLPTRAQQLGWLVLLTLLLALVILRWLRLA